MRQAGVSMVAAASVDEVAAAIKSATDTLLGPLPHADVLLAVRADGTFRAVAGASADPVLMTRLAELADSLAASHDRLRADPDAGRQTCPPKARTLRGLAATGCCSARCCSPTGRRAVRSSGVLAIFDGQRTLADLFATLEILAYQVAPRGGADPAARRGDPPGKRGVLPHPDPRHLGRHPDRRRRGRSATRRCRPRASSATSP